MNKKAIIIGSTGLIGTELIQLLVRDENYSQIIALVRTSILSKNKKLTYVETDFNHLDKISSFINGHTLFICVGSTMAKSGSKDAFLKVDYNIPVNVAAAALKNGVKSCIVVSSLGADASSSNFYLQTKGKMEKAIENMGFNQTIFMRPSLLLGSRKEFRLGELIGKLFMKLLSPFFLGPLKKYKGIQAKTVAEAMFKLSMSENLGIKKYESNEIEQLIK